MRRKAEKSKNKAPNFQALSHRNKIVLIGVGFLVVLFLWVLIDRGFQGRKLDQAERMNQQLVQTLNNHTRKIADFQKSLQQIESISSQYKQMLARLPAESEMAKTLKSVSKLGASEELKFVLFKPRVLQTRDFYDVTPVQVVVLGDYHHVANFIDKVASLPDLVTVSDFVLARENESQNLLSMRMVVYVYARSSKGEEALGAI